MTVTTTPTVFAAQVVEVRRITPAMCRVTFHGADLTGFVGIAPDHYVKLFLPAPGQEAPEIPPFTGNIPTWYQAYLAMPDDRRPAMRTYTIRSHDPGRATVDIDFVLHGDTGPASRWAERATPGQQVCLLGPAALDKPTDGDFRLIVGDATALPAIGAIVEQLPPGVRAWVFAEVAGPEEEQSWQTDADVTVHWVHLDDTEPGRSRALLDAVRSAHLPAGRPAVWIAGEAAQVRELRRHAVRERGIDKRDIAFTGYWRIGVAEDQRAEDEPDDPEL